jgi:hypothetical protein
MFSSSRGLPNADEPMCKPGVRTYGFAMRSGMFILRLLKVQRPVGLSVRALIKQTDDRLQRQLDDLCRESDRNRSIVEQRLAFNLSSRFGAQDLSGKARRVLDRSLADLRTSWLVKGRWLVSCRSFVTGGSDRRVRRSRRQPTAMVCSPAAGALPRRGREPLCYLCCSVERPMYRLVLFC